MQTAIIKLLADGQFHSGQEIADRLKISRAAVWKQIRKFEELGLEIASLPGRGYRLQEPLDLLGTRLSNACESLYYRIEIHQILASTSDYLRRFVQQSPASNEFANKEFLASGKPALACFCEYQTQGRGRRGRSWFAPYAGALCFSVLWKYDTNPMTLNGLSLAVGTEIVSTFNAIGLENVGLKWPNDLFWNSRKLGGILFEIIGEESGPCYAIVGVGINISLSVKTAQLIDQDWVDLKQVWNASNSAKKEQKNHPMPSRNKLAGQLLEAVSRSMNDFGPQRFEYYRDRWREYDCCFGQSVSLTMPQTQVAGIAQGIDEHGQFVLKTSDGLKRFASGEVSLRIKS